MAFDLTAVLRLNSTQFRAGMASAERSLGGLKSGAGEVVKSLGLITSAGAAVGLAFASVKKAMDFESEMSTIQALTGATGKQITQMKNLALDMGQKTKYSALEAAQGIEELLKAGLTPAQVKAGGLENALNLATAGGLSLASASEIMSTALNAFKGTSLTATQAANILAGTANASATDVEDLRLSLAQVSAVAAGVGLSFRDTNSALGLFANFGLKGSDAGTSFKTMLTNLQPQTKKQVNLFQKLGLETKKGANAFYDAHGNLKSLSDIAGTMQNAFKGMTAEQRQAAMQTLFGTDAIRAANILYKSGTKGVKDFNKEMSKVSALDVAKQKMNNAAGAVEQFKGALETLQIAVLTPLMPVIKDAANNFANWVQSLKPSQIKQWGDDVKKAGQKVLDFANFVKNNWGTVRETIVGITTAVLVFKGAMAGLLIIQKITKFVYGLQVAYQLLTGAQIELDAAMDANPIGAVIALIAILTAAGVLLYRNWDKVAAVWSAVWDSIKGAAETSINFVIAKVNKLIGLINHIPGIKLPYISAVNFTSKQSAANPLSNNAYLQRTKPSASNPMTNNAYMHSHSGGLNRVPYDGYIARLHKDERVVTAGNSSKASGGSGVVVSGNTFIVRQESDIHAIAYELAKLIEREGA